MKYIFIISLYFIFSNSFCQNQLDLYMSLPEEFKLIAKDEKLRIKVYQTKDKVLHSEHSAIKPSQHREFV